MCEGYMSVMVYKIGTMRGLVQCEWDVRDGFTHQQTKAGMLYVHDSAAMSQIYSWSNEKLFSQYNNFSF